MSEATAAAILAPESGRSHGSALEEAMDFLQDILADGAVATNEIIKASRAAGISWATMRRAKEALCSKPGRRSCGNQGKGEWMWELRQDA